MTKPFARFIALLLVSCLASNETILYAAGTGPTSLTLFRSEAAHFQTEAFALPAASATTIPRSIHDLKDNFSRKMRDAKLPGYGIPAMYETPATRGLLSEKLRAVSDAYKLQVGDKTSAIIDARSAFFRAVKGDIVKSQWVLFE